MHRSSQTLTWLSLFSTFVDTVNGNSQSGCCNARADYMPWIHKVSCKCHLQIQQPPLLGRADFLHLLSSARSQMPQIEKRNTLQIKFDLSEEDYSSSHLSGLKSHIQRAPQKSMGLTAKIPALFFFPFRQKKQCHNCAPWQRSSLKLPIHLLSYLICWLLRVKIELLF